MGVGSSKPFDPDAIIPSVKKELCSSNSLSKSKKIIEEAEANAAKAKAAADAKAAGAAGAPLVDSKETTETTQQEEVEPTVIKQGGKRHTKGKRLKRKKQKKRTIRK